MVGSVSSWSSTETTSECPYWAAQWSAVSFSWFCGRMKGKRDQTGGASGFGKNGNQLKRHLAVLLVEFPKLLCTHFNYTSHVSEPICYCV